jgi:hypothetical protein
MNALRLSIVALALVGVAGRPGNGAQLTYSRGQNVSPAYEGWEELADGSRYFVFGYQNRNWDEEIDVPVGPDNNVEPGGPDQGQPTHFLPRRNLFVFKVRVPKGFTDKDELVWTLATRGKAEKAYASLRPDYFVDAVVQASEFGAFAGASIPPGIHSNNAPGLKVDGEKRRAVRVGEPVTLAASATDDGNPSVNPGGSRVPGQGGDRSYNPPRQGILTNAVGLRLSWFVYRGAAKVTFDPEQTKVWQDTRPGANSPWAPFWQTPPVPPGGKWLAHATFHDPGTYVLRCVASDGALQTYDDVTFNVAP